MIVAVVDVVVAVPAVIAAAGWVSIDWLLQAVISVSVNANKKAAAFLFIFSPIIYFLEGEFGQKPRFPVILYSEKIFLCFSAFAEFFSRLCGQKAA